MEAAAEAPKPKLVVPIVIGLVVLALLILLAFTNGNLSGFLGIGSAKPSFNPNDPTQYLSREIYFKEAFQPDRQNYRIFESASKFTGRPLSDMPRFFSVANEAEIFEALPPIPKDFSEIAFLLANGKFFAISGLGEEYYKQPEFYPNFTNRRGGLRYWVEPDPWGWGTSGWGTYPSSQETTLKRGQTENFEATIFLYSGFGVQTYQGATLFATGDTDKFTVSISPQTFVLEPTFPKFHKDWAKKILVRGSLKPGTPAGNYKIAINLGIPPEDKRKQWGSEYRNLYMDAGSGVRPGGNSIDLFVKVE